MTKRSKPSQTHEKKSEMLDVRLPYGLKRDLVQACRKQGVTVSDTVRRLLFEYVAEAKASDTQPVLKDIAMKIALNHRKTLAMTGAAALFAFLFSVQPSMADDKLFASYDKNHDGIITVYEIHLDAIYHLDTNHNNTIEPGEFQPFTETEITTSSFKQDSQGQIHREISATYKKIDLTNPGDANISEWGIGHTLPASTPINEVEDLTIMMLEMMKNHAEGVPHYEAKRVTNTSKPK